MYVLDTASQLYPSTLNQQEGDGKKKKKVKTRKQKGEKEIRTQQAEDSNCPQVEEGDSQRAGDSQGQSLKKR